VRHKIDRTEGITVTTRTTSTRTRTPTAAPKLQRFTVTADVLLTLDVEAGSPDEALAAYQALRLARPELHGRGGVSVLLPADSPAVVTSEAGKEVLRVQAVGLTKGKKSRFNGHPVSDRRRRGGDDSSPPCQPGVQAGQEPP
jgi:hypothetical protein